MESHNTLVVVVLTEESVLFLGISIFRDLQKVSENRYALAVKIYKFSCISSGKRKHLKQIHFKTLIMIKNDQ